MVTPLLNGTSASYSFALTYGNVMKMKGSQNQANVLIADDNPLVRCSLFRLMERWGVDACICENGRETWAKLQSQPFDMLLIDLQMPEMDGYEVVSRLRAADGNPSRHIPIVVLAGASDALIRTSMFEAGINEYLLKPFTPADIFDVLVRYTPVTAIQQSQFFIDGLDEATLELLYETDKTHLGHMMDAFIRSTPQAIAAIETAMEQEDCTSLEAQVHKIKPTFTMVGLPGVSTQAEQLDEKIRRTPQLNQLLKQEIRLFIGTIRQAIAVVAQERNKIHKALK